MQPAMPLQSQWTVDTLKEHFEILRGADHDANEQRFKAQETAIDKAEDNRDTAIKKAEDSIEKKSDAVYVKLTDLQKALTEVMLRPEIEARFNGLSEKVDDLKTSRDTNSGKYSGIINFVGWIVAAIAIASFVVTQLRK